MTPEIQDWVANKIRLGVIPKGGRILEVGSRNVNGGVRHLFHEERYFGIDIEAGPGVDHVLNVHDLWLSNMQFDTVLALEVLEHDADPVDAVKVMRDRLVDGGLIVISTPTVGFPEHRHPKDYWRFLRDAYTDVFFRNMQVLALDEVKCPQGFPGLIGVARK